MERKYLKDLINWKNDDDRKPLLVLGARQVGKSYLIEELFAKKFYADNYLRIDCSDDPEFVKYVHANDSLNNVLDYINIHYDFEPAKDKLLIIDEVQECLPLLKMMKHFCEKRRDIPLIVTGSLVRIKIKRQTSKKGGFADKNFLFPVGKINELIIYPLTFDEFLFNYKNNTYKYLYDYYRNKKIIPTDIHNEILNIFYEYLFVGGMPEVVATYIKNKDDIVSSCKKIVNKLKEIYNDYLSDMELYQASPESIIRSRLIFNNIYSQLNKENKNFKCSQISSNLKNRDLISPIGWLTTAKIVNKSYLLKEKVTTPLVESEDSLYRLYLSDMGLFTYQGGLNAKNFILDKTNAFSGIYFENYISTELVARDIKLFYWKGKRDSELEFIIDLDSKIIPIDVKKGRGALNSLNEFRYHNKKELAIKVSKNQYGYNKDEQILTIPFYYLAFMLNDIKENNELEFSID